MPRPDKTYDCRRENLEAWEERLVKGKNIQHLSKTVVGLTGEDLLKKMETLESEEARRLEDQ
jgi:hypothetical protein